ncbi:MAG: PAS domain S-box protein [Firmicutes bacterium]|nr:PAS domain S-box protein [Bacillota bacterium]
MVKYRILHVDDDENNLEIFKLKFRDRFSIVSCLSPSEAIELITRDFPDAVVTDYEMPGLNGLELFAGVKQKRVSLPVVFYTGQGNEEVAREAFLAGVADYLTKSLFEVAHWQKLEKSIINAIEKQNAISKAEETSRKLETLIRNIPGLVYRCINDNDWTMEFVSDNSLELCGYLPEEIINNYVISFNDIIHPDDRIRVWEEVQNKVSVGQPFSMNYRIVCKDGTVKNVVEYGRMVGDEEGNPVALEGVILDDDGRKKAEQRINDLNRLMRAIVDINQLILTVKTREELLERICSILLNTGRYSLVWAGLRDEKECFLPVAKANENGNPDGLEVFAELKKCGEDSLICECFKNQEAIFSQNLVVLQKEHLWAAEAAKLGHKSSVMIPIKCNNKVAGIIFVYSDIENGFDAEEITLLSEVSGEISVAFQFMEETEFRLKAEKDLKKSEYRYRTLFENSGDAIFLAEKETGIIVDANRQAELLTGLERKQIVGMFHSDLYPEELRNKMEEYFRNYTNDSPFSETESSVKRSDGILVPVHIFVTHIHLRDKVLIQGIFKDISGKTGNINFR